MVLSGASLRKPEQNLRKVRITYHVSDNYFAYHVLRIATYSRIDMFTYFYVSRIYVLRIATYLRITYRIRHMKGIVLRKTHFVAHGTLPWEFPWVVPHGTSHGTSHGNSHGTPPGTFHGTSHGRSHGTSHGTVPWATKCVFLETMPFMWRMRYVIRKTLRTKCSGLRKDARSNHPGLCFSRSWANTCQTLYFQE